MLLKCIGGNNDGEMIHVPDHYINGDYVKVQEKLKPVSLTTIENMENITIDYYIYRIECLSFINDDDRFRFLVPKDWTIKQAIVHQFNK